MLAPSLDYPHVSAAFYNQPWAILPEKLSEMEAILAARIRGEAPPTVPSAGPRPDYQVVDRTALIPIFGVISQRMSFMQAISGGTSTEYIGRQLDQAVADRSVRSIVLVIDSPGGSVFGVSELASKINAAKAEKKIIAIADSMAASAAYWIGAQAGEFYVTPGGMVGSVGVVAAHQDQSKAEEMIGIKTTLIHAGKYKVEGDPSQPLSAEGAAYIQDTVDKYYRQFVDAVAKGRGVTPARVEKDFGQGRMKVAADAKESGMVDKIGTLETILRRLGADAAQAAGVAAKVASYGYEARAKEIVAATKGAQLV